MKEEKKIDKPLKEHYEVEQDGHIGLQTFRYIEDLEKWGNQLASERWHCDKLVEAMGGLLKQGHEILEVKQELQTLKDAVHWVLGQHGVPEWIINKLKTLSR